MPARLSNEQRIAKYGNPLQPKSRNYSPPVRRFILTKELQEVKFWCHSAVTHRLVHALVAACEETGEYPTEIQSYNVRKIAGSASWSLHSWALAWDVFATDGPVKDPKTGRQTMSKKWFEAVAKHGEFVWGGTFRKADPHHIEWPY